jgi:uncharacterized phiE125 gp8 family phage protein
MTIKLVQAPATEPVSVAEAKAHLRVDHAQEDGLIAAMITAVRQSIETHCGLALISQRVADHQRTDGAKPLDLQRWPFVSMLTVKVTPLAGATETLALQDYAIEPGPRPARVVWRKPWLIAPGAVVECTYDCGFGPSAADVPSTIRQTILEGVAMSYADREGGWSAALRAPLLAKLQERKL